MMHRLLNLRGTHRSALARKAHAMGLLLLAGVKPCWLVDVAHCSPRQVRNYLTALALAEASRCSGEDPCSRLEDPWISGEGSRVVEEGSRVVEGSRVEGGSSLSSGEGGFLLVVVRRRPTDTGDRNGAADLDDLPALQLKLDQDHDEGFDDVLALTRPFAQALAEDRVPSPFLVDVSMGQREPCRAAAAVLARWNALLVQLRQGLLQLLQRPRAGCHLLVEVGEHDSATALLGLLLGYPITYWVAGGEANCLGNIPLRLTSLVLRHRE
jgi:hypothetical protein